MYRLPARDDGDSGTIIICMYKYAYNLCPLIKGTFVVALHSSSLVASFTSMSRMHTFSIYMILTEI